MLRAILTITAVLAVTSLCHQDVQAQTGMPYPPSPSPAMMAAYGPAQGMPARPMMQRPAAPPQAQYPYLGAPLYPCPQQNIPVQVGGTMYTNDAFAPHEMLYPHEYKAMYPPFYYRVKGSWIWTPFGMESHDKWKLMGTEVNVKYRSSYSLLSGFIPPR